MLDTEIMLQERLRNNDKTTIDFIYKTYKREFLNYFKRFELDSDQLEDVYQDSLIALYQSFVIKQTILKKSTVKTYLFGIGKNLIFDRFKSLYKTTQIIEDQIETQDDIDCSEPTIEQLLLRKHFDELSESCKDVLRLYYYRGLTIEEIVQTTDYKDSNTVKSHKSRCMKYLKTKISNH